MKRLVNIAVKAVTIFFLLLIIVVAISIARGGELYPDNKPILDWRTEVKKIPPIYKFADKLFQMPPLRYSETWYMKDSEKGVIHGALFDFTWPELMQAPRRKNYWYAEPEKLVRVDIEDKYNIFEMPLEGPKKKRWDDLFLEDWGFTKNYFPKDGEERNGQLIIAIDKSFNFPVKDFFYKKNLNGELLFVGWCNNAKPRNLCHVKWVYKKRFFASASFVRDRYIDFETALTQVEPIYEASNRILDSFFVN